MKLRLPKFKKPDFSDPVVRVQAMLIGGAVAMIAVVAIAVTMPLSSNPQFCGRACHNMNPEYQTWKRSSHAKVTCTACHVDPTLAGLLHEKAIEGPIGLFDTIFERHEKPINPESEYSQQHLPRVRCERCHANENREFTFSNGIYMNHKAHNDAGLDCAVCHNRVTHKGAEEYEPLKSQWAEARHFEFENFLTMRPGCSRCHSTNAATRDKETMELIKNGKKPPTACGTCHTKQFPLPKGHRRQKWRARHGDVAKADFGYCFRCHDADSKFNFKDRMWCEACHDPADVQKFKSQAKPHS